MKRSLVTAVGSSVVMLSKVMLIISPIVLGNNIGNIILEHFILGAVGGSDIEKIQEIKLGKWKLIEFSGLNQPTGE